MIRIPEMRDRRWPGYIHMNIRYSGQGTFALLRGRPAFVGQSNRLPVFTNGQVHLWNAGDRPPHKKPYMAHIGPAFGNIVVKHTRLTTAKSK